MKGKKCQAAAACCCPPRKNPQGVALRVFADMEKEKGRNESDPKAGGDPAPLYFSEGLVSSSCRLPLRPFDGPLSSPGLSGFLIGFLPATRRRAAAAAPRFFIVYLLTSTSRCALRYCRSLSAA